MIEISNDEFMANPRHWLALTENGEQLKVKMLNGPTVTLGFAPDAPPDPAWPWAHECLIREILGRMTPEEREKPSTWFD